MTRYTNAYRGVLKEFEPGQQVMLETKNLKLIQLLWKLGPKWIGLYKVK